MGPLVVSALKLGAVDPRRRLRARSAPRTSLAMNSETGARRTEPVVLLRGSPCFYYYSNAGMFVLSILAIRKDDETSSSER